MNSISALSVLKKAGYKRIIVVLDCVLFVRDWSEYAVHYTVMECITHSREKEQMMRTAEKRHPIRIVANYLDEVH